MLSPKKRQHTTGPEQLLTGGCRKGEPAMPLPARRGCLQDGESLTVNSYNTSIILSGVSDSFPHSDPQHLAEKHKGLALPLDCCSINTS